jgi:carbamoyltransferase
MSQVVEVDIKCNFPAITHVDGTARLQTVNEKQNPYYHKLLKELERLSGYPICLNTSFNFKDQTITMTPTQAIERFIDCDMDALVINNFYITKTWLRNS